MPRWSEAKFGLSMDRKRECLSENAMNTIDGVRCKRTDHEPRENNCGDHRTVDWLESG